MLQNWYCELHIWTYAIPQILVDTYIALIKLSHGQFRYFLNSFPQLRVVKNPLNTQKTPGGSKTSSLKLLFGQFPVVGIATSKCSTNVDKALKHI
jgi:hypothetical protein